MSGHSDRVQAGRVSFDLSSLAAKSRKVNSGPRTIAIAGGVLLIGLGVGAGTLAWFTDGRSATPVFVGLFGAFGALLLVGGLFGRGLRVPTAVEAMELDSGSVTFRLDSGRVYRLNLSDPEFNIDIDDISSSPLEEASMHAGLRFWLRLGGVPRVAQSAVSLEGLQALVALALASGLAVDQRIEKVGGRREGTGEQVRRLSVHRGPLSPGASAVTNSDPLTLAPLPTSFS
jgi:predicted ribosomally synthesized peptide with SipW-like signal peptide